jgi:multiple sugar transport system ATP-binding protein
MRVELLNLHRKLGSTIVYVTHDQVEAMTLAQRICVLKEGVVQQVDTPLNIYKRPGNIFVASFFGSPAMNFFPGRLIDQKGHFKMILGPAFEVPVNAENYKLDRLKKNLDGKIIAGIRPGAFRLPEDKSIAHFTNLFVDIVELIGDEKYVHCNSPELGRFTAALPAESFLTPGDNISLNIHPDSIHLFDASGKRI